MIINHVQILTNSRNHQKQTTTILHQTTVPTRPPRHAITPSSCITTSIPSSRTDTKQNCKKNTPKATCGGVMHLADSTSSGVIGCVWKRDRRRRLGTSRFCIILCSDIFMLNNLILSERLRFAGSGSSSTGICTMRHTAGKRHIWVANNAQVISKKYIKGIYTRK